MIGVVVVTVTTAHLAEALRATTFRADQVLGALRQLQNEPEVSVGEAPAGRLAEVYPGLFTFADGGVGLMLDIRPRGLAFPVLLVPEHGEPLYSTLFAGLPDRDYKMTGVSLVPWIRKDSRWRERLADQLGSARLERVLRAA